MILLLESGNHGFAKLLIKELSKPWFQTSRMLNQIQKHVLN